jgi:hypothetical protein
MADTGEPFQATDAIAPGEAGLLSKRFISATQRDCHLYLYYERGGGGAGRYTAAFDYIDDVWVLREIWLKSLAARESTSRGRFCQGGNNSLRLPLLSPCYRRAIRISHEGYPA